PSVSSPFSSSASGLPNPTSNRREAFSPAGASTSRNWPLLPVKRENFRARVSAPLLALSSRTAAGKSAAFSAAATTQAPPSLAVTSADPTQENCTLYLRHGAGY